MTWIAATIIVLIFGATGCFGIGRLQQRLTSNNTPFWITGLVITTSIFIVFTAVFGILFFVLDADVLGGQGNLKLIHAPAFAAVPTTLIGLIYIVGIVIRVVKPDFGEKSS